MPAKKETLEKPVMVRMDRDMHNRIRALAEANGLSTSDIIRLSVRRQLPALASGQTRLNPA